MNQDAFLAGLQSVTDQDAAAMVSDQAMNELAEQITAVPIAQRRVLRRPWRLPIAALSAVVTAAAIVAAVVAARPLHRAPAEPGSHPARLAALIFTSSQGYIDVVIRNFYADPAIYRAEFAAHHLDITLLMVPGSPSVVGTLALGGGNGIGELTQPGRCWEPGGGACVIGVRIPDGFRGSAQLAFVRPARPGERYDATGQVTARGEALYRLHFLDQRVGTVLAMLAGRHVTVGAYSVPGQDSTSPRSVPADWYVTGADPYAPGQVLLVVGRTLNQPAAVCRPVNGLPCPATTPSPDG
jgi:hypothetical protein